MGQGTIGAYRSSCKGLYDLTEVFLNHAEGRVGLKDHRSTGEKDEPTKTFMKVHEAFLGVFQP